MTPRKSASQRKGSRITVEGCSASTRQLSFFACSPWDAVIFLFLLTINLVYLKYKVPVERTFENMNLDVGFERVRALLPAIVRLYMHTYIHTYIHTHIHTCIHTYTCTHASILEHGCLLQYTWSKFSKIQRLSILC
jgi:hypothetical protein